jgi:hypothetical protein
MHEVSLEGDSEGEITICNNYTFYMYLGGSTERGREREKERDRQTDRGREKERGGRGKEGERERERERGGRGREEESDGQLPVGWLQYTLNLPQRVQANYTHMYLAHVIQYGEVHEEVIDCLIKDGYLGHC